MLADGFLISALSMVIDLDFRERCALLFRRLIRKTRKSDVLDEKYKIA
jgi:hypothetical protein